MKPTLDLLSKQLHGCCFSLVHLAISVKNRVESGDLVTGNGEKARLSVLMKQEKAVFFAVNLQRTMMMIK